MKNCYFWATPSGPINLIKAEDMPVERKACITDCLEYSPCACDRIESDYLHDLQRAKESSVPIQDQDAAKRILNALPASQFLSCCPGDHSFNKSCLMSGKVYGPFTVEYRIEDACAHDSCPVDGMCEHCKEPVKVAILLPDKEPWEDQEAFLLHLIDVTACFVMEQNMFMATSTRKELIQKARETFTTNGPR